MARLHHVSVVVKNADTVKETFLRVLIVGEYVIDEKGN